MGEGAGVLAAMLSSGIEGASIGVTRFIAQDLDALAIGAFQFGIGFALLPFALRGGRSWPKKGDWPRIAALGLLFFGVFPALFNASLALTAAARGALALSTLYWQWFHRLGSFKPISAFGACQWAALGFLGAFGGASASASLRSWPASGSRRA